MYESSIGNYNHKRRKKIDALRQLAVCTSLLLIVTSAILLISPLAFFGVAGTVNAQTFNIPYNTTGHSPSTNSGSSSFSGMTVAANNNNIIINNNNNTNRPQTFNINFRGQSADAYWYSYPASYDNGTAIENETYTDIQIFASDQSNREHMHLNQQSQQQQPRGGAAALTQSSAYVGIYRYIVGKEACVELPNGGGKVCYRQDIPVLSFSGYADNLTQSQFQVDRRNEGATLNATVTGFDSASNSNMTIDVKVRWSGNDDLSTGNSNYHVHSGDYNYNSHSIGSSRTANITATIAGDIQMTLDSPPLQYEYGNIYTSRGGQVVISQPPSP